MSITERSDRPDRPYVVRWREEGRHRSRAFATEKDAIKWEGKVQDRLAQGAHAPDEPSRMRLEDWTERWVDAYGPAWAERTRIQRGDILIGLHQWETLTLDNVMYVLNHPEASTFTPLQFFVIRGGQVRRGSLQ